MTSARPTDQTATHAVANQPGPPQLRDLWASDRVLQHWARFARADEAALARYGASLGGETLQRAGRDANRQAPELVVFDRAGQRLDEVRFHPGYHQQMATGVNAGYAARPWETEDGGHAAHAGMVYLLSQVDPGVCCPLTMTYAGVAALRGPTTFDDWVSKLTSRSYDPSVARLSQKSGATLGMAMTEKQGGSDVRANATRADHTADGWRLTGHKWFCSAPMSDGFLTLAQVPGGLSCFLVPRWLEDGSRNGIHLMRLKDKLGNRSNASAEIEFVSALGLPFGDEGDGVRTILDMVHHTRLDTAMAPAGLMRAALVEAHHWVSHRSAFQRRLIDQPLMRQVLSDLVLDWEGATALGMRVARAFDAQEGAFARVAVALAKFLSNKRCPVVIAEAMEVLGGIGYVEETPLPMLYREAPLNGIWEGSGNVICLDILRTLAKQPKAAEALNLELDAARGSDTRYDTALDKHQATWRSLPEEPEARLFAERAAQLLTASVLIREATSAVAEGFVASRLAQVRGQAPGAVAGLDTSALLRRLAPVD